MNGCLPLDAPTSPAKPGNADAHRTQPDHSTRCRRPKHNATILVISCRGGRGVTCLPPDPRRAIRTFGLILGIALAVVVGASLVVDPNRYWNLPVPDFPQVIAHDIEQKMPLLEAMRPRPRCLIIGSSHVLMVEPDYVEGKTGLRTFNWGVNSAMVETEVALLGHALHNGLVDPRLLIIGVDTGGFSGELDRRLPRSTLVRDYMPFEVSARMRADLRNEAWESLFDWNTFRRSLSSMERKWSPGGRSEPLKRDFAPDGMIRYPRWQRQKELGTFDLDRLIRDDMEIYPERYAAQEIDPRRVEWFEQMVREAGERGARVVCFTTPLHPKLDAYVRERSNYAELLGQVKDMLGDLAGRYDHMTWVDCSSIETFGGRADWYWDGAHASVENTRLIVDKCLGGLPDAVQ